MPRKKTMPLSFWLIPVYAAAVTWLLYTSKWLLPFLVCQLIVSVITMGGYAWDKSAAVKNRWRTPESTLHFLALLGGWPGAMIAQHLFRHKTQKQPFRFLFWLTIAINASAVLFTINNIA